MKKHHAKVKVVAHPADIPSTYVRLSSLAGRTDYERKQLYQWIYAGKLPAVKFGDGGRGTMWIDKDKALALLDAHKAKRAPAAAPAVSEAAPVHAPILAAIAQLSEKLDALHSKVDLIFDLTMGVLDKQRSMDDTLTILDHDLTRHGDQIRDLADAVTGIPALPPTTFDDQPGARANG